MTFSVRVHSAQCTLYTHYSLTSCFVFRYKEREENHWNGFSFFVHRRLDLVSVSLDIGITWMCCWFGFVQRCILYFVVMYDNLVVVVFCALIAIAVISVRKSTFESRSAANICTLVRCYTKFGIGSLYWLKPHFSSVHNVSQVTYTANTIHKHAHTYIHKTRATFAVLQQISEHEFTFRCPFSIGVSTKTRGKK